MDRAACSHCGMPDARGCDDISLAPGQHGRSNGCYMREIANLKSTLSAANSKLTESARLAADSREQLGAIVACDESPCVRLPVNVKCDEPECGWHELIDARSVKDWIGEPCPKCGAEEILNANDIATLAPLVGLCVMGLAKITTGSASELAIRIDTGAMRTTTGRSGE